MPGVCLSVCLLATLRKTTERIFTKILLHNYISLDKKELNFGSHLIRDTDPGIFWRILQRCEIRHFSTVWLLFLERVIGFLWKFCNLRTTHNLCHFTTLVLRLLLYVVASLVSPSRHKMTQLQRHITLQNDKTAQEYSSHWHCLQSPCVCYIHCSARTRHMTRCDRKCTQPWNLRFCLSVATVDDFFMVNWQTWQVRLSRPC